MAKTAATSWRRWGLLGALALAYLVQIICFPANFNGLFSQTLLEVAPWLAREETRLLLGALGYALALAIFAWCAAPPPSHENDIERRALNASYRIWIVVLMMGVTLGLVGLSMLRFALSGEDALVRWLWLAGVGMLTLAASFLLWEEHSSNFNSRTAKTALANARLLRIAVVLALLLGGAAWLRFQLLADIPDDLHGDMASMGLQARAILSGAAPGIFHQGWANIPMLGFYPSVIGLKFVSNSILGLNFMPAVEGTLTALGLYLLAWRLFDSHRLAALAAAMLAINIPHIHFSRLAAYMDPWPWIVFAFVLLVHGLRKRKLWPFPVAGMLLGISLQMYYSGRIVLFILPVTMMYLALRYPQALRRWLQFWLAAALLLALGGLTVLGPSLIYFLQHTGPLLERSRSVFLFHPPVMTHLMGKYGVDSPWAVLWRQVVASVLMFNASHDSSTQFGYTAPMFGAAISPLVLLGIGYSLRWWRRPGMGFALIWLFSILVIGSIFTNNAPFWPRLVGVLPAAALMAGVTLAASLETLGLRAPISALVEPRPSAVAMLALAVFIALAGQRNWQAYVRFVGNNARAQARIGRYLDSLPDNVAACSFSQPYRLSEREIAFLAWPHRLLDLSPGAAGEDLNACPGPARVWILAPADNTQLARVQLRWPGGQLRTHRNGAERPVFLSYLLTTPSEAQTSVAVRKAPASSAFLPDGSPFHPQQTWLGDESSSVTRWRVGPVRVTDGHLHLIVGPVAGHDAVFDYIELIDAQGRVHRFEAEAKAFASNDVFASQDGVDNHWWAQDFAPFSGGRALVARKGELVPALVISLPLANGLYDLSIGTFTGDPANGVFGLGVAVAGSE